MTKIHFLEEFPVRDHISRAVLCNGNGVYGVSLDKNYQVTKDTEKVTCKKCLKILDNCNNYQRKYKEGDTCPKCKKDILVITQETDTGWNSLRCQDPNCNYEVD